ncbi:MAG: RNA 3'-terminal phosphate cyclase, partial [Chthoniobacteraceae bacterium]
AEKELKLLQGRLSWTDNAFTAQTDCESPGPGNAVMVEIGSEHVSEIITGFGEKGIRAEQVVDRVIKETRRYLASPAPVGEHLTDQLLLPLALAGGGSFTSIGLSRHALTNIEVIQRFLPVRFETEAAEASGTLVRVVPA